MADYRQHGSRLFEVTVLAPAQGDVRAEVELFEMGADGGSIGVIRDHPGRPPEATLYERASVPVPILEWWMGFVTQSTVAERSGSIAEADHGR